MIWCVARGLAIDEGISVEKVDNMYSIGRRFLIALMLVGLLVIPAACGSRNSLTEATESVPPTATVADALDSAASETSTPEEPTAAPEAATQAPSPELEAASPTESDAYPAPEEPSTEGQQETARAYPAPEEDANASETDGGYPAPAKATVEYKVGPDFSISTPVVEGATVVSGTGFAALPIMLVDVSESGAVLADTVVADDGTFRFDLTTPLPVGHTIGLKVGDLDGTEFNADDFRFSPDYYERPYVGTLLDMASTEEAK